MSDDLMQVELVAADRLVWSGEAKMVIARTTEGDVGILPNHAPFMTLLGEGSLTVRRGETVSRFSIRGGFLQVVDNRVRVVTEHVQGESHAS